MQNCDCCGKDIPCNEGHVDDDGTVLCHECWLDDGSGFEQTISDCW